MPDLIVLYIHCSISPDFHYIFLQPHLLIHLVLVMIQNQCLQLFRCLNPSAKLYSLNSHLRLDQLMCCYQREIFEFSVDYFANLIGEMFVSFNQHPYIMSFYSALWTTSYLCWYLHQWIWHRRHSYFWVSLKFPARHSPYLWNRFLMIASFQDLAKYFKHSFLCYFEELAQLEKSRQYYEVDSKSLFSYAYGMHCY